jgi:AraC-like DNA-binding protein
MKRIIHINEINPNIRYASFHDLKPGYDSYFRHLRHYQMIYVFKGKGEFVSPCNSYIGEKGNLFLWPSMEAHRIISSKESHLTVFGLQFDLTEDSKDKIYPVSWISPANYDSSYANENIEISEIPELPTVFYLDNILFYENLLFELVKEYRSKLANSIDICESILRTILVYTFRNYLYYRPNKQKSSIKEIIQFIYDNTDKKLNNKIISEKYNYHANYLNRLFKKFTNLSLHQFVINAKLNKSIEYMQTTDLTLTQISDRLVFSSLNHFSKQFKDKTGISPSSFKNGNIR